MALSKIPTTYIDSESRAVSNLQKLFHFKRCFTNEHINFYLKHHSVDYLTMLWIDLGSFKH